MAPPPLGTVGAAGGVLRGGAVSVYMDGGHVAQNQCRALRPQGHAAGHPAPVPGPLHRPPPGDQLLTWTANTMLVAVVATGISLLLGSMLAYPLARMRFRGAAMLAVTVAVTYLVPQTLLFVPMADLVGRLKLGNTLSAVMLTYPTLLVPFIAWLLMGYFKTVPKELEEQALIDGAGRFGAMTPVILPLCMPGFISAGIFAFTLAQNEFLYALLFLSRSSVRTVPVEVLGELIRGEAFYWGQLMAGPLLGSIPVALIYSFFVKYYVAGLTAGAVKG